MNWNKNYKSQIKSVLLASGIFAASFSLIACGKSNTAEVDQNNFFQSCSNCSGFTPPGSGNDMIRTVSQDSQGLMQMALSFMSQNYGNYGMNQTGYYGTGATAMLANYSGLTATYGQVTFLQNFNLNSQQNNYCLLPAGVYQIRPVQAATWSSGTVSNLRILLTGPSQVVMNLNFAQISNLQVSGAVGGVNGVSVPAARLVGNALVETINGNSCQIALNLQ